MNPSRFLAAALGVALGLLPVAPPEHVHETEEHGHGHLIVHRHLQPHGILEHHGDRHATLDDDDDDPIETLTTVYSVPAAVVLAEPPRTGATLIEPPAPRRIERVFTDVEILIHGPPRAPASLRAPPVSLSA